MKTSKTIEIDRCDFCETESAHSKCGECGKDICYDCKTTAAVEYPHAVYFNGSRDGLYCHDCDERLKYDPLHRAYAKVTALRRELKGFHDDFTVRYKAAEAEIARLLDS